MKKSCNNYTKAASWMAKAKEFETTFRRWASNVVLPLGNIDYFGIKVKKPNGFIKGVTSGVLTIETNEGATETSNSFVPENVGDNSIGHFLVNPIDITNTNIATWKVTIVLQLEMFDGSNIEYKYVEYPNMQVVGVTAAV